MKEKFAPASIVLWTIAGLSLFINIVLVNILLVANGKLSSLQGNAATALSDTATVLEDIKNSSFDYTVAIDEDLPVTGDIPVSFVVRVPIKTTIPINTSVTVPVSVPYAGTVNVVIPIYANVPIDMTVDVPIEETIPIDITVPVQLEVPISVAIADTPLAQNLTDLQAVLGDLYTSLTGLPPSLPATEFTPTP
jgi:hypothetical protein